MNTDSVNELKVTLLIPMLLLCCDQQMGVCDALFLGGDL